MSQTALANTAIITSILAIILSAVSLWFGRKSFHFSKIFGTKHQPDNLEEVIESITELLKKLRTDQTSSQEKISQLETTLETAFQYSSVVRFDSGGSDGGNLSFTMALLDGHQSGVIITSLHGREHNRIYCKAVLKGESVQQLSEEEREAFIGALTSPAKQVPDKLRENK